MPSQKFEKHEATIEFDAAILRKIQPLNMTSQQYASDLVAKSYKFAAGCDNGTINAVLTKRIATSICNSLRDYWEHNPLADLPVIYFQVEYELRIQKKGTRPSYNNQSNLNAGDPFNR